MLYYLHLLSDAFSPLNIFRYITFRALMGAGTAFAISVALGPWMIERLRRLKYGQPVRKDEAPPLYQFHGKKAGTPTMGGLLIMASVLAATLLWAVPSNGYVLLALGTMAWMGGVGFLDDYIKVRRKRSKGLGARQKLVLQLAWAFVVTAALYAWPPSREHVGQLMVPFVKDPVVRDMTFAGALVFLALVLVGSTNAVNLTDGLDGLAIGCSNAAAAAYLALAYVAGHTVFARYLQVPHVPGSGELAVFCGCLLGAGLGFLWYNCHPARVFMGDTGSLALGGSIAMVAIAIKQELLLAIVGGVFVMEAASVIVQVVSFKMTGRRVFRCAPIHHHFELLEKARAEKEGRDVEVVETMITTRFWVLAIICALLGVATLKIR
jgi:phospho-N-acetylmuramoyl-pentapeptide-transferase